MESNKMKGLFLDDERVPQDVTWVVYPKNIEWTVVRSYDEFFHEFHRGQFQVISFDHDIQVMKSRLALEDAEKVQKMLDALDDCDDVQDVYTNADLPEDDEE